MWSSVCKVQKLTTNILLSYSPRVYGTVKLSSLRQQMQQIVSLAHACISKYNLSIVLSITVLASILVYQAKYVDYLQLMLINFTDSKSRRKLAV